MSPVEIAAELLGVSPAAFTEVEHIKHGLTNESWRIRSADHELVVRISAVDESALQIDRTSEASILQAVSAEGIGPQVLLCDPARRVLVTRYIAGSSWDAAEARRPQNIERLAALLRRLHAMPIPAGARKLDLLASVERYWRTLEAHGTGGPVDTPVLRRLAREAVGELARGARTCLCHNDLNPLNVLDDGRLRLIDWEYAAIAEPLFDLASACCGHGLGPDERERLRLAYCGSAADPRRLELACWLFDYIRDLWMAVRQTAAA